MTPDPLTTLLRRAYLAAPLHPPAAQSLRTRARHRRARNTAAITALLCALTAFPFLHHTPPPSAPTPAPVAIIHPSPSVDPEIQSRIATETALRLAQRRATGEFLTRDPAFARDAAAQTLVLAAERRRAADPLEAARTYAAAATLFPNTPWGRRAATALSQTQ
jgi:hypothetical protein